MICKLLAMAAVGMCTFSLLSVVSPEPPPMPDISLPASALGKFLPPPPEAPGNVEAHVSTPQEIAEDAAMRLVEWQEERSTVYTFWSMLGWPTSWDSFDTEPDFVDPEQPHMGASMRYYYNRIGRLATRMGVDGLIITNPSIYRNGLPVGAPGGDRLPFEGRKTGLEEGASVCDERAIIDGLVMLRLQFTGKLVLYMGHPDPQDKSLRPEAKFRDYVDGYVRQCIGPWMKTGYIDAVIMDASGSSSYRPEFRAVLESIKRQWPRTKIGAEAHPDHLSGGYPFTCSLTTQYHAQNPQAFGPWTVPITANFFPVWIFYSQPRRFDDAYYNDALSQLRLRRSVAIQAWTVGYSGDGPTPANRAAWEAFMTQARAIRNNTGSPN